MSNSTKRLSGVIVLLAVIFISISLRPPVAIIGPLIPEITSALQLAPWQIGLLSALPVFCFGIGAFASPFLVNRLGLHRAMFLVLGVLVVGEVLRLFGAYIGLLFGTLAVGLAIAVANVLMPSIIRTDFPKRIGFLTGLYTMVIALSASLAATTAVPVSAFTSSWAYASLIWAIPTFVAILLWLPKVRERGDSHGSNEALAADEKAKIQKSLVTWSILLFFALQSTGFYAVLNWLPSLLIARGISAEDAGYLLGLTTFVGVPFGFILSSFLKRFDSLAALAAGISLVTVSGFVLLLVMPALPAIGCVLIGLGQASTFPLSLSLIAIKANSLAGTTYLSTISQGWGYILAGAGTFLVGFVATATGAWSVSLIILIALSLVQVVCGWIAGRPGQIAQH